ncbi:MAG: TrkH family potassium uptake protein [Halanaerobium sp.]|nr:TrkH family potassium uptake protein [Halanaerobium sp.]
MANDINGKVKRYISGFSSAQFLVLGYFVVILTGTILLTLPMATTAPGSLPVLDAIFTATSATCVTGLIVVNTAEAFTLFGQIVILILIQVGGLGIMTMSTLVFFIIGKKITLKERLLIQEDLNQFQISGLLRLVQYILFVTVVIEGLGAVLLFFRLLREMPPLKSFYFALFHSISAFNNAGFDIFGNSLESFTGDWAVNLIIISLIILGGLGFVVLLEFYRKFRWKWASLHTKLVLVISGSLLLLGTITVLILEYNNPQTMGNLPWYDKILSSFFLATTPRTAGFNTVPTGGLNPATLFFVVILMFIGASPGSTAGGIKTTTFGTLLAAVKMMVKGDQDIEIFNRRLDSDIIYKVLAITFLSAMLVIAVTMILTITEGQPFQEILFETVSAFGTVGLSTGVTPTLSATGKILIIITMFAGRVGPLTLAIAFGERKYKVNYRLPQEKIMVG